MDQVLSNAKLGTIFILASCISVLCSNDGLGIFRCGCYCILVCCLSIWFTINIDTLMRQWFVWEMDVSCMYWAEMKVENFGSVAITVKLILSIFLPFVGCSMYPCS